MVKEIADKMDAHDCSCPLDLLAMPDIGSRMAPVEEVLQKLEERLSPPDPSNNYNIGLRELHEETATWFLEGRIFQEWYTTGSMLWIHGKRSFVESSRLLAPDGHS